MINWEKDLARAAKALQYLADHPRPSGGQEEFNAEDCYELSSRLEVIKSQVDPMQKFERRSEYRDYDVQPIVSIAFSLKRIADALNNIMKGV